MKRSLFALAILAICFSVAWQDAAADGILPHHHRTPPVCEAGFKIVEEIVLQDVSRQVCKIVQEHKKKWVYSFIDDPFCVKETRRCDCVQCAGPHCRKQLVKREVIDPAHTTTKCVVVTIVEKVPVTVYRKVPIDAETLPVKPKLAPAPMK
jgi:hypothetical protein